MGARFLIDTNAVIDLLESRLPPVAAYWLTEIQFRKEAAQSIVTRIELLSQRNPTANTLRSVGFWNEDVLELSLDDDVAAETIRIRQTHRRKLPDAVIAATALVHNLPIITRNLADFRAISRLRVLDPHDPAALPAL